eukprot:TRINITY_DN27688_c0_g1_i5.p1 TRINITY_DN27688_c0_g1~~TRINITY_DN27688_c0_g1_i5.p1  ORF type:complete len:349 (+),score=115.30 TRINITY_DN27688_c0_g1_i5:84-1049(+)
MGVKRYAVLHLEDAAKWAADGLLGRLWEWQLNPERRAAEQWDHLMAFKGELPPPGEYSGVVLTGSRYNVSDAAEWMAGVRQWICQAAAAGAPRIFAGCFGIQLVAAALGGAVGSNPDHPHFRLGIDPVQIRVPCPPPPPAFRAALLERRAELIRRHIAHTAAAPGLLEGDDPSEWDAEREEETMRRQMEGSGDAHAAADPAGAVVRLVKSHGDAVVAAPPGAAVIATGPSARCEGFVLGTPPSVLALQGHPEMVPYIVRRLILPAIARRGLLPAPALPAAGEELRGADDAAAALWLIRRFLDGEQISEIQSAGTRDAASAG